MDERARARFWVVPCVCCDLDELLSLEDAAHRLGVASDLLEYVVSRGKLHCALLRDGAPRFCGREIQAFALRPDLVDTLMG